MANSIEILKKHHRHIYTGLFSDKNGSPDFKGIGPICKDIFLIYILFLLISKNITYSGYILIIVSIGKMLNAIRFYYVNTLIKNGNDEYFIDMNVIESAVESGVLLFVGLYLLMNTWIKKL